MVREYRGYKYVVEDLFHDDAATLADDGWCVASTEWGRSYENMGLHWRLVNWWEKAWPWRPTRTEYLLPVTYERELVE